MTDLDTRLDGVTFYGRPVEEMTRPQLLKCIEFLTEEYARVTNENTKLQQDKIFYMKTLAK